MEVFRSLLRFILKVKELYLHATQTFHVEICMFALVLDDVPSKSSRKRLPRKCKKVVVTRAGHLHMRMSPNDFELSQ